MKTVKLSLKSLMCHKTAFFIILVQLSVCFALLIGTASSVFSQFNIITAANNAHRDYIRLTTDYIFVDNYMYGYESSVDYFRMYFDYLEKNNIDEADLTDEQAMGIYQEYLELADAEADEKHYLGKYHYIDLYNNLHTLDCIDNIVSNYWTILGYQDDKGQAFDVNIVMMDKTLYEGLDWNTRNNKKLSKYSADNSNYFYAIKYPSVSIGDDIEEIPYDVGDIIVDENVYNFKEHRFETFYYEIVDEYVAPTYILPDLKYSGDSEQYTFLDTAFITEQSMMYNGALVVLKPDDFDISNYYTTFAECFTLVKLQDDFSDKDYNDFLKLVLENGFNANDLNTAEANTINKIWEYIRENSFILVVSLLMVIISIISVSVLSGNRVRRENAIYKLCGASNWKLKIMSAIKWGLIFFLSMILGTIISGIYSSINTNSNRFAFPSVIVSSCVFVFIYVISFVLSYKAANVNYSSSYMCEEENND